MGLLSSIAAALSEGVGNGMVASAKWGIEEDQQAKKEKAEADRQKNYIDNQKQINKENNAARSAENKAELESRAKDSAADRDMQWRIANLRAKSGGGGSSNSDELRGLRFVDGKITDFDTQIGNMIKAHDSEMDPQKQLVIAGQIDVLRAQRKAFITNPATTKILDSSGDFGKAYAAALFGDTQPAEPDNTQKSTIPKSLLVPPPSRPDANQSNWSGGDPSLQPQPKKTPAAQNNYGIWDRVSSDVSSLRSGLLNKMNNAYKDPLDR